MRNPPENLILVKFAGRTEGAFMDIGITSDGKRFEIVDPFAFRMPITQEIYRSFAGEVWAKTSLTGWRKIGQILEKKPTEIIMERYLAWRKELKEVSQPVYDYPPYNQKGHRVNYTLLRNVYKSESNFFACKFNLEDKCERFSFPTKVYFDSIDKKFVIVPWIPDCGSWHAKPIAKFGQTEYYKFTETKRDLLFSFLTEKFNPIITKDMQKPKGGYYSKSKKLDAF